MINNYNPKPFIVQATGSNKHASLKHHCLCKTEMLIIMAFSRMAISRMTLSRTINKSFHPIHTVLLNAIKLIFILLFVILLSVILFCAILLT